MRLFHYLEHLLFLDLPYLHPIYTHIPQYPEITGYFSIPTYNRMVPLLTIERKKSKSTNKAAFYLIINLS